MTLGFYFYLFVYIQMSIQTAKFSLGTIDVTQEYFSLIHSEPLNGFQHLYLHQALVVKIAPMNETKQVFKVMIKTFLMYLFLEIT